MACIEKHSGLLLHENYWIHLELQFLTIKGKITIKGAAKLESAWHIQSGRISTSFQRSITHWIKFLAQSLLVYPIILAYTCTGFAVCAIVHALPCTYLHVKSMVLHCVTTSFLIVVSAR